MYTCAHDSCKDPALAIPDRFVSPLVPLPKDGHASAPLQGVGSWAVLSVPLPFHYSFFVVAVNLKESVSWENENNYRRSERGKWAEITCGTSVLIGWVVGHCIWFLEFCLLESNSQVKPRSDRRVWRFRTALLFSTDVSWTHWLPAYLNFLCFID